MVCLFAACGVRREGQEPSLEGDREVSTVSREESGKDVDSVPEQSDRAENDTGVHSYDSVFPQHEPYGKGIGAMPGRVVWDYDTASVLWDGEGFWWWPQNFDESVIQSMVNDSIASLGGKETAEESWRALFQAHNEARGKGSVFYASGEKVAIKANINGSGVFDDDTFGETKMGYTNSVLLKTLLVSLVEEAGVKPSDI